MVFLMFHDLMIFSKGREVNFFGGLQPDEKRNFL